MTRQTLTMRVVEAVCRLGPSTPDSLMAVFPGVRRETLAGVLAYAAREGRLRCTTVGKGGVGGVPSVYTKPAPKPPPVNSVFQLGDQARAGASHGL